MTELPQLVVAADDCMATAVYLPCDLDADSGSGTSTWPRRLQIPAHGRYPPAQRLLSRDTYVACRGAAHVSKHPLRPHLFRLPYDTLPEWTEASMVVSLHVVGDPSGNVPDGGGVTTTTTTNTAAAVTAAAGSIDLDAAQNALLSLLQCVAMSGGGGNPVRSQARTLKQVGRYMMAQYFLDPRIVETLGAASPSRRHAILGEHGPHASARLVLTYGPAGHDDTSIAASDPWYERWMTTEEDEEKENEESQHLAHIGRTHDPLAALAQGCLPGKVGTGQRVGSGTVRSKLAAATLATLARRSQSHLHPYLEGWTRALRVHLEARLAESGWAGVALACASLGASPSLTADQFQWLQAESQGFAAQQRARQLREAEQQRQWELTGIWQSPGPIPSPQRIASDHTGVLKAALVQRRRRTAQLHIAYERPSDLATAASLPPCMKSLLMSARTHGRLSHADRRTVAGWLAAMDYPTTAPATNPMALARAVFGDCAATMPPDKITELSDSIRAAQRAWHEDTAGRTPPWGCGGIIADTLHTAHGTKVDTATHCPFVDTCGDNTASCQRACAERAGLHGSRIYHPLDHLLAGLRW